MYLRDTWVSILTSLAHGTTMNPQQDDTSSSSSTTSNPKLPNNDHNGEQSLPKNNHTDNVQILGDTPTQNTMTDIQATQELAKDSPTKTQIATETIRITSGDG